MSVNSVLEGYLTVFGWQVYGSLFLLLVAAGLVIYPVARIVFDAVINYGEQQSSPAPAAGSLMIRLAVYVAVLLLGLVPLVPVEINRTSVQNQCNSDTLEAAYQEMPSLHDATYGFGAIDDARVPALPYLAMVLAAGFNAVMYEAIPCVHDLVKLNMAMNMLDYSQAENPNALRANVAQFERECYRPALRLYRDYINGRHGTEGVTLMRELMVRHTGQNPNEQILRDQIILMGSPFFLETFYQHCPAEAAAAGGAGGWLCNLLPLRASNPVEGFPFDPVRDSDVSQQQAAAGVGFPTCHEWWTDGQVGLRKQLADAGRESFAARAKEFRAARCGSPLAGGHAACVAEVNQQFGGLDDLIVRQMQLSGPRNRLLDESTQTVLGWGAVGLGVAALFGMSDAASALAGSVAGYYTTMYLFKLGASLFQPFLLMTIFLLWGVFLIIGEMRGMALIKGMMLIFVLSILPSLWSLADHIGNQLFLAMYPEAPMNPASLAQMFGDHSTVERLVLDVVTTMFYVVLPLLMLYLVAEAGAPAGARNMASEGVNSPAQSAGGLVGGPIGAVGGRAGGSARGSAGGRQAPRR